MGRNVEIKYFHPKGHIRGANHVY